MPQRLSPKERFRLGNKARVDAWLEWCSHPQSHEVLEVALAEYAVQLDAALAVDAVACAYKLMGAKAFVYVLLNLAEQVKPHMAAETPQLKAT